MKLYKYMTCHNDEAMTRVENLIQYGWVSFSSPSKFDDLFEKKLLAQDKDLFIKEQHQHYINKELSCRRILCLSETNNSHVLWHYYADACKGVCIEIDVGEIDEDGTIALPLESGYSRAPISLKRIQYLSSDEKGKMQDDMVSQNDIDGCLYLKTLEWAFEKEWRAHVKTISESPDFVAVKLDPNAVTAVYMGPYISHATKMRILRICHTGRFDIPAFIKHPNQATFEDRCSIPGMDQECTWRSFT